MSVAPTKVRSINSLTSTAHTLFALATDGTLWFSDDYTVGWTALVYGGSGTPVIISSARWPGPSGNIYLFVAASDSTLWRYDRDSGSWLSIPYLS